MINKIDSYKILNKDNDLIYTEYVAYQTDRTQSIDYGDDYFTNYVNISGTSIANKLNNSRVALTEKHCKKCILDIGIGSGEFILSSKKLKVYGFDINPYGVSWLKKRNLLVDPYRENDPEIEGFTLWDVLEHMPNPDDFTNKVLPKQFVFISIPTFVNFRNVKKSKHYKPNEHYYYFSIDGLIKYMDDCDFKYIEHNDMEIKAGREGITSFVFRKV